MARSITHPQLCSIALCQIRSRIPPLSSTQPDKQCTTRFISHAHVCPFNAAERSNSGKANSSLGGAFFSSADRERAAGFASAASGSSTFSTCRSTLSGRANMPCLSLHLKYRWPFTTPSCFPSAVEKEEQQQQRGQISRAAATMNATWLVQFNAYPFTRSKVRFPNESDLAHVALHHHAEP